jgi:hypothetical protein
VTLEERLVDRDVFDGDNALQALDFDDPIYQQERIPMRQDRHNLLYVERARGWGILCLVIHDYSADYSLYATDQTLGLAFRINRLLGSEVREFGAVP